MKVLQYRLDIRLKYPIKDGEVENVNEAVMKRLSGLLIKQEELLDNVESAILIFPGASPDDPMDLTEV